MLVCVDVDLWRRQNVDDTVFDVDDNARFFVMDCRFLKDFWDENRDVGPTERAKVNPREFDLLEERENKKTLVAHRY